MIKASRDSVGEILVDRHGAPVWPLGDLAERRAVSAICRSFGQTVGWVSSRPMTATPGRDAVAALGADAVDVARLYAHLTQRRLFVASCAAELARAKRCKAIVCLIGRIDDDLLEQIYGPRRRVAPGLITGRSVAELRCRALTSAVAATSSQRALPHRIEMIPSLPFAMREGAAHAIMGRQSPPAAIRRALGRGRSAIMIHGHGDGIDGDLGELVLCPVDADWQDSSADRAPVCRTTGMCYRRKIAIAAPEHQAGRMHPGDIAARALIWNTCLGFPSPHGFIDPAWSVGVRLAVSPRIGALLTTWRITITPAMQPTRLLDRMMAGETVGRALAWYNSSQGPRKTAHKMCLFGDPDITIAPKPDAKRHRGRPTRSAARNLPSPQIPRSPRDSAETRFIAACLNQARTLHTVPSKAHREGRLRACALGALAALRAASCSDLAASSSAEAEMRLRRAVVTYAAQRGMLRDLWIPLGGSIEEIDKQPCPSCAIPATRFRADLSHLDIPPRTLINCNRCEIVADRPEGLELAARITHDAIELIGDCRGRAWTGIVCCGSRWPVAPRYWRWPTDRLGRPQRLLSLADQSWPYPAELSVFLAVGLDLCVLSRTLGPRIDRGR